MRLERRLASTGCRVTLLYVAGRAALAGSARGTGRVYALMVADDRVGVQVAFLPRATREDPRREAQDRCSDGAYS